MNKMIARLKRKPLEFMALILSLLALLVSWNNQITLKALYGNNEKVIVYSDYARSLKGGVQLRPLGDDKHILSMTMVYPKKIGTSETYMDAHAIYVPDEAIKARLYELFRGNRLTGTFHASIPVRLITRYATQGEAYTDDAIYIVNYRFTVSRDVHQPIKTFIEMNDIDVNYTSRAADTLLAKVDAMMGITDESNDINRMFTNGTFSDISGNPLS
ncbi:hypothetical protein [Pantoea sp. A4]|uniref:hypothetical protein n=1 Tax=Pantoea sp. A4 TaxID=1225184 RepID=UPI00037B7591|nr:hypothetical protein [Pantoea sp. A4]